MGGSNLHRHEDQSSSISCWLENSRVPSYGEYQLLELENHHQPQTTTDVEKGCNSGNTKASTKQRRKRKRDSLTRETIHQYFGKPIGEASKSLGVSRSTLKRVCRELQIPSWPLQLRNKKYADHSIRTPIPRSKSPQVCFGIYEAACLLLALKRWRNRTVVLKRRMSCNDYLVDGQLLYTLDTYQSYPKKNVVDVLGNKMVTVKATYKNDMIKFPFPLSSGLLELKDQVAQRFKLNSTKLLLKYMDEDDDLILIACDSDFRYLMPFSATSVGKNILKLIVLMAAN